MSGLKEKIFCPMSAEHENAYLSTCAERILHYDGIFLFIIVVIQIYNIIYALLYTQGRLHTTASRVYTVLYLLLLFFTIAGLILQNYLRKSFPQKVKFTVRLQKIYGFILLLWGACITLYDQRVSNNISVYVIISLGSCIGLFHPAGIYCRIYLFPDCSDFVHALFSATAAGQLWSICQYIDCYPDVHFYQRLPRSL